MLQCLQSTEMAAAWGPACFLFFPRSLSLSLLSNYLVLNTHRTCTRTGTNNNNNKKKKTHTRKKEPALSQTSASQLASALISPWKGIIFQLDAFSLFIVSRPKPYQQLITACQIRSLTAVMLWRLREKKRKKKKRRKKNKIQWIIFSSSDCHFRFGQSPIFF